MADGTYEQHIYHHTVTWTRGYENDTYDETCYLLVSVVEDVHPYSMMWYIITRHADHHMHGLAQWEHA